VLSQPEAETRNHLNVHVTAEAPNPTVTLTEVQVRQMTVIQLKYELSKRKLPKTGKKEVLLEHLLSSLNSPVIQLNIGFVPATLPTPKNDAASSECSSSSYWVILNRSETLKNLNEIPILWAQKYQRMKQSP
jgi:hypothetical protein